MGWLQGDFGLASGWLLDSFRVGFGLVLGWLRTDFGLAFGLISGRFCIALIIKRKQEQNVYIFKNDHETITV